MIWKIAGLAALLLGGAAQGALAQAADGFRGHRMGGQAHAQGMSRSTVGAPPAVGVPGAPRGAAAGRWSGGGHGWVGRSTGIPPTPLADQTRRFEPGDHRRVGFQADRWHGRVGFQGDRRVGFDGERRLHGDQGGIDFRRHAGSGGAGRSHDFGAGRFAATGNAGFGFGRDLNHDGFRDAGRVIPTHWSRSHFPPAYASGRRFHAALWIAPPNYFYRVWRYGEFLPATWYGPDYRMLDWWNYDLPEPPPGYDWVRVGDDVVLVEQSTGRIVQVVRDVFY